MKTNKFEHTVDFLKKHIILWSSTSSDEIDRRLNEAKISLEKEQLLLDREQSK
jgi:hypothetical protein